MVRIYFSTIVFVSAHENDGKNLLQYHRNALWNHGCCDAPISCNSVSPASVVAELHRMNAAAFHFSDNTHDTAPLVILALNRRHSMSSFGRGGYSERIIHTFGNGKQIEIVALWVRSVALGVSVNERSPST